MISDSHAGVSRKSVIRHACCRAPPAVEQMTHWLQTSFPTRHSSHQCRPVFWLAVLWPKLLRMNLPHIPKSLFSHTRTTTPRRFPSDVIDALIRFSLRFLTGRRTCSSRLQALIAYRNHRHVRQSPSPERIRCLCGRAEQCPFLHERSRTRYI